MSRIGVIYRHQGNLPKALEFAFKAQNNYEILGNKKYIAINLTSIGNVYSDMGNYTKALEYFSKALKYSEELGQNNNIITMLTNIGNVYENQKDYNNALDYYLRAIKIADSFQNKNRLADIYPNIGEVYRSLHQYYYAIEYHFRGLHLNEELGKKPDIAVCYLAIAVDYVHIITDTQEKSSLKTNVEFANRKSITDTLIPKSKAAILKKAIEYCKMAITINKDINDIDQLSKAYLTLSVSDSILGNYKEAYFAKSQYIIYRDSVFSQSNTVKIARLEMQQKITTDSLNHLHEQHIAAIKYQQQRNYTYLGVAGVVLLLGFSFFIFRTNRRLNSANTTITNLVTDREKTIEIRTAELRIANTKLVDLIHYNAHNLREPLTRVIGVMNLREYIGDIEFMEQYWDMMDKSVLDLDERIKQVITELEAITENKAV